MRPLLVGILLSSVTALASPSLSTPDTPSAPPPRSDRPVQEGAPPRAGEPVAGTSSPRAIALTVLPLDELPDACRDLGKLADSPSPNRALSARISLASCLVEHRLRELVLCDCEHSIREIDEAIAQSTLLLDEVFAAGDPATKVLARQALGDLLAGLVTRMLATVPQPVNASEAAFTLHETRLTMLQPLLDPWRDAARAAYRELDQVARANPQLAKNPAVLAAVRAARAKQQQQQLARQSASPPLSARPRTETDHAGSDANREPNAGPNREPNAGPSEPNAGPNSEPSAPRSEPNAGPNSDANARANSDASTDAGTSR
jgi:hypothetical protein